VTQAICHEVFSSFDLMNRAAISAPGQRSGQSSWRDLGGVWLDGWLDFVAFATGNTKQAMPSNIRAATFDQGICRVISTNCLFFCGGRHRCIRGPARQV
jgi:hypothetical protein